MKILRLNSGALLSLLLFTGTANAEMPAHQPQTLAEQVAKSLNLSGHLEGGYYRRTYESTHLDQLDTEGGQRFAMTSIFYMLTKESPIGHWHLNKSSIMHYYHLGDPMRYYLIYPDGRSETVVMGSDVANGQLLQLHVPGNVWKGTELLPGEKGFGLISEAVVPGFDYADMTLGRLDDLVKKYPQHKAWFTGRTKE